MRNLVLCGLLGASLAFFAGCSTASSPVLGAIYSDVKGPITSTTNKKGSKEGKAVCTSILGIVAWGDCSIEAARKTSNITNISTVDHETFNVLGIYSTYTTIITGN